MQKDGRDTHLFVISNCFQGEEALELYRQRWGIERLFGHLKKKGFDLESTHLTDPAKLERLFAVVVLAFPLQFRVGLPAAGHQARANRRSQTQESLFVSASKTFFISSIRRLPLPSRREEIREFLRWLNSGVFASIFLV